MEGGFSSAYESAIRLIAKGDKFEAEVRASLARHSAETVDAVIARLKDRKILDDRRTLIQYSSKHADVGYRLLAERLSQRGAPERLIGEIPDLVAERTSLVSLLSRRYPPQEANRGRAARFLLRRGFDEEDVENALERYFGSSIGKDGGE